MGAAVWTTMRQCERSTRSRTLSGSCHIRCSIVGTMRAQLTRSLAISASAASASNLSVVTTQLPRHRANTAALNGALW